MTWQRAMVPALAATWLLVLLAALATVQARHEARKLFVELQQLHNERDELEIEWGRLRLEQSAYANHGLIERVARDELGMSVPAPDQVVLVQAP